jgi:predicted Zn-dependent peptidase
MIRKEVLGNGLTLISESIPHVRSVSIGVWLRTGSRHEARPLNGISHFIEHLVFKGTEKRTAQELALVIDSIGGQVEAFTGKEYTCFYTKVLDEHVPVALDLLSDIVLRPRFDPEDIEKERKVIYEEMRMVEDSPDELVYDLFSESWWQEHPLARPIQGTRRSVASLSPRRLAAYFRGAYVPGNMVITAAGRLKHEAIHAPLRSAFGKLKPGRVPSDGRPPKPRRMVVKKEKASLEQLHICLGVPSFPATSSRRYALLLMSTILGGTMSSRLWQRIREGSGLAYSVYAGVNAFNDCGFLMVYAATNPATGDKVVRQICEELRRIKNEPVGEGELRVAKDNLKGSLMLSLESTSSRMSNLARADISFGRQFGNDEVLRFIERVTAAQVQAVARDVLNSDLCGLAALGRVNRFRTRSADLEF